MSPPVGQSLSTPEKHKAEHHAEVSIEELKEEGLVLVEEIKNEGGAQRLKVLVKDILDERQVCCCFQDHLKKPSSTEGDQETRLEEHDADHPESAASVYKGKQEDVR